MCFNLFIYLAYVRTVHIITAMQTFALVSYKVYLVTTMYNTIAFYHSARPSESLKCSP